jgi:hypothetical protein
METFKRLAMAYLGVGFIIAVIENWTAHAAGASSAFDVVQGMAPLGDKVSIVLEQVVVPIIAWPFRVWGMIRGG